MSAPLAAAAPRKNRHSLARSLLRWFLLLSLLPMMLTASIAYQQAIKSVNETVSEKLEHDARESARAILNWFDYRFMDIENLASNHHNAKLLTALKNEFHTSNQTLASFTESATWHALADNQENSLIHYARHYDYIHDLLLIDTQGNILFTTANNPDLGTNIFNGHYASTQFTSSAKKTLETGLTRFSDLEHYAPLENQIVGFISAPLFNDQGNKIGLIAMQVQLEQINQLINSGLDNRTLNHYLVGSEGLLRTPLESNNNDTVLQKNISTSQIERWQKINDSHSPSIDHGNKGNAALTYLGPNGKTVIGVHHTVEIPGVNWLLISEINQHEALAPAHQLGLIILLIFLLTSIAIIAMALYLARRITRPIIELVNASKAISAGHLDHQVAVNCNNEIGILADAFNSMSLSRLEHDLVIEQNSLEIQEALIDLEEQKFALDQHSIVAITDVTGTINFINDKFSEISGYSRRELLGENHRMLNSGHHDAEFFRDMYQTISSGKVWHGEICNRRKDGQLYWVDTTIVPFVDEKKKPESYIAIRTDISKRKQIERELIEAKEHAEAATQQKSEFLANMSHEIRTPMNGIIGMSGLLLETDLTSKQRSYVNATISSADALLTIINDILDFSKIEAGKLTLEEVPFDLLSICKDVAELMALKCSEKGVEMLLRYKPGTPQFVIGDPGRVRQILLNLLSNAVKFTPQGNILLTIEPAPSHDATSSMAAFTISVKDSGIGIAQDKLSHIFSKFNQEDSSTTRKYGGTGLGLAICKQLCNMMQGDIQVTSEKNSGSTFSFTIKLNVDPAPPQETSTTDNQNNLKGMKALIVDDCDTARTIFEEQLSTSQIRDVVSVASGSSAIKSLQSAIENQDPFDILIIDYLMAEMDGEELATKVVNQKLLNSGIMLFVTSSPRKGEGAHLKLLGFDGYLTKPTHPSEIAQMLTYILQAKQQKSEIPLVTRHTLRAEKSGQRKKPVLSNAQILLVEDNPINLSVATELLEGYGCTVTPAGNGLEAVTLTKQRDFDLIFMDCLMPEMDGFEATTEIRKLKINTPEYPKIPIIAFTANAMKSDRDKCLQAGMDDYISKPVSPESLEKILIKWLEHKVKMVDNMQAHERQREDVNMNLEILDLTPFNQLKEIFGDKFPQIIEQHTQNALENVKRAEEAIQHGDLETLELVAHSIKGASGQFGAVQLINASLKMEALAKDGHLESAKKLLEELKTAQQEAAEAMRQEIEADAVDINQKA